jgi:hypothetical protein
MLLLFTLMNVVAAVVSWHCVVRPGGSMCVAETKGNLWLGMFGVVITWTLLSFAWKADNQFARAFWGL